MARWCICPIVGTGTSSDPFRAKAEDVAAGSFLIPSKPDGTPKYRFAFGIASSANIPALVLLSNTYVFPDYALDATLDGMDSNARSALAANVPAYDLDGLGKHLTVINEDEDSFRDSIDHIGRQFEPAFNSALVSNPDASP